MALVTYVALGALTHAWVLCLMAGRRGTEWVRETYRYPTSTVVLGAVVIIVLWPVALSAYLWAWRKARRDARRP